MKPARAHKLPAVALLQLGSEVHAAVESAAQRSGYSKSEFVRLAVQGAIQAQPGYWERLLIQVFCAVPELVAAAADAGLLTQDEANRIEWPIDKVRQRLYGELDRIDGLPSIHWPPAKDEPTRAYEEVMRTRASRDGLVRPEIASLERLRGRFSELADQRFQAAKKTKTARRASHKHGSKSLKTRSAHFAYGRVVRFHMGRAIDVSIEEDVELDESQCNSEAGEQTAPKFAARHYMNAEIAALWSLSDDSVRKIFERDPGVLVIGSQKLYGRKRSYTTIRVPEFVLERVHRWLSKV
ncbi:MAG: hypothetical protein ABSC10_01015 [Candidatus Acidiferrales bacterium]|jgi:hypothetical protein